MGVNSTEYNTCQYELADLISGYNEAKDKYELAKAALDNVCESLSLGSYTEFMNKKNDLEQKLKDVAAKLSEGQSQESILSSKYISTSNKLSDLEIQIAEREAALEALEGNGGYEDPERYEYIRFQIHKDIVKNPDRYPQVKALLDRQKNLDDQLTKIKDSNEKLSDTKTKYTDEHVQLVSLYYENLSKIEPLETDVTTKSNEVMSKSQTISEKKRECANLLTKDITSDFPPPPSGSFNYSIASRRRGRKQSSVIWHDNDTFADSELADLRNVNYLNWRTNTNYKKEDGPEKTALSSPSKSFYMNHDYLFSDSLGQLGQDYLISNKEQKPEIQKLILNEFQPYKTLTMKDVLASIGDAAGQGLDIMNNVGGSIIFSLGLTKLVNYNIDQYSRNPELIYSKYSNSKQSSTATSGRHGERFAFTADPIQMIHNMFNGGIWLNTYELPYYGTDYLIGKYSDKWTVGGIEASMGGLGTAVNNFFGSGDSQSGLDYPSNPRFKVTMGDGRRSVSTNFFLINSNSKWLKRNFAFLHAIFAGTSWLHMRYCMVRPPNVYHVLCPGRFQMYWAAMDCTVKFVGKLRKNPTVSDDLNKIGIKSIDTDMLWPDAWEMNITITDLTPNNFNLYAEYYQNGFIPDEVATLGDQINLADMKNQVINYITNALDGYGGGLLRSATEMLGIMDKTDDELASMKNKEK